MLKERLASLEMMRDRIGSNFLVGKRGEDNRRCFDGQCTNGLQDFYRLLRATMQDFVK